MNAPATVYVGKPQDRVDGPAKVTGSAKYAAEYNVPGLLHGVIVSSPIAKGRITKFDASEAMAIDGVVQVFSHENAPSLAWFDRSYRDEIAPPGSPFRPLHDNKIAFSGQPVAVVVAETFELARYAAMLVRVEYEAKTHQTSLEMQEAEAYVPGTGKAGYKPPPKPRGHAEKAFKVAAAKVDFVYSSPSEHHNPMESFASTVVWDGGGKITIYDKTQGVQNCRQYVTKVFGYSDDDVRIISPFMGGGFGSGLRPQYQLFLAVLAARELQRSVRVSMTRQQMFTFAHRPSTRQRIALGAAADGELQALIHEAVAETSRFEDHTEIVVNWSTLLYNCPNVRQAYKLTQLDVYSPSDMRAPGAALGVYGIECAMDELAAELGMDPVALRLRNYAVEDQNEGKPFSSKELKACYEQGAERFGWAKRDPRPRSMRRGSTLIGWGMASGAWDTVQSTAAARAVLTDDGKLTVSSATSDIGTGTYTIMTQIAAETLGLSIADVTFRLGDSSLPHSPVEGGSWTASSVGSAVKAVCETVAERLLKLAQKVPDSPLAGAKIADVLFADGKIVLARDPNRGVGIVEAMRHGKTGQIEEETTTQPDLVKQATYSMYTHSAIFVEVEVDEDFGSVKVSRVVSAIAGGHVLNPKTARSQILGGVVWGVGMALEEESVLDHAFGRFMNHSLAEYHIPVNADIGEIDVIFVEEKDEIVNPLGAKGLGEIGIIGVAAAIANAVYHATGKRVRDLPITLDKLL